MPGRSPSAICTWPSVSLRPEVTHEPLQRQVKRFLPPVMAIIDRPAGHIGHLVAPDVRCVVTLMGVLKLVAARPAAQSARLPLGPSTGREKRFCVLLQACRPARRRQCAASRDACEDFDQCSHVVGLVRTESDIDRPGGGRAARAPPRARQCRLRVLSRRRRGGHYGSPSARPIISRYLPPPVHPQKNTADSRNGGKSPERENPGEKGVKRFLPGCEPGHSAAKKLIL